MRTTENSDHPEPLTLCDWDDVRARLVLVDRPERRIYGVPPGGMIAAGFCRQACAVPTPDEATHVLVDVVHDDRQMERFAAHYKLPILALFDRTHEDRGRGALVMPWEDVPKPSVRIPSGLRQEEWQIVERLAECHSLMSELDGLDAHRFDDRILALQEMVLALPSQRAMLGA